MSSRNIKILEPYQILYLSLSIILWIIITIYYLTKICLLIYIKLIKRIRIPIESVDKIVKIATLIWYIVFGLAFGFLFIGLITDIVAMVKGNIGTYEYPVIYFFVGFCYIILSFFDYILIEQYIYLIFKERPEKKKEELAHEKKESSDNIINGDNKENIVGNIKQDIKEDNKEKIKDVVNEDIKEDNKGNINDAIKQDIKEDNKENIKDDIKQDIKEDNKKNMKEDIKQDIKKENNINYYNNNKDKID